ncbi:hypothetical protein LINPERPRIM_LOCUS31267 [Linum perenne]
MEIGPEPLAIELRTQGIKCVRYHELRGDYPYLDKPNSLSQATTRKSLKEQIL